MMKFDDVIVSFCGVWKIYDGEMFVVKLFDFDIYCGEFLMLFGLFGLGKIICLMMFVGFEFLIGGEICFDGELLNNVLLYKCNIGMVF